MMNFLSDSRVNAAYGQGVIGRPKAMQQTQRIGGVDLPPIGEPAGDYGVQPPSRGYAEPTNIPPENIPWNAPPMPKQIPGEGTIPSENIQSPPPPMPSAINSTNLSDPSFYPGGGTTTNLQTVGGVPFDTGAGGPSSVGQFMHNRVGPLSPVNYNWFQYPGGINKPSYKDYLSSFPSGGPASSYINSIRGSNAGSKNPVSAQ